MLKFKFLGSPIVGGLLLLIALGAALASSAQAQTPPSAMRLTDQIQVSEQIRPEHLSAFKAKGFRAIVDLRPDGEEVGQPSSLAMAAAAKAQGLEFDYVPIPPAGVPPSAVQALGRVLDSLPHPVLLYCRTGTRAARAWALMEAARPSGMDARAIEQAARVAGRPVDDLREEIAKRIAQRRAQ